MFIDGTTIELEAIKQSSIDELFQRAIDRRLADVVFMPFGAAASLSESASKCSCRVNTCSIRKRRCSV